MESQYISWWSKELKVIQVYFQMYDGSFVQIGVEEYRKRERKKKNIPVVHYNMEYSRGRENIVWKIDGIVEWSN